MRKKFKTISRRFKTMRIVLNTDNLGEEFDE